MWKRERKKNVLWWIANSSLWNKYRNNNNNAFISLYIQEKRIRFLPYVGLLLYFLFMHNIELDLDSFKMVSVAFFVKILKGSTWFFVRSTWFAQQEDLISTLSTFEEIKVTNTYILDPWLIF